MPEKQTNTILAAVFIIIVIIAAAVLIYVNLPAQTPDDEPNDTNGTPTNDQEIVLTVIFDDQNQTFTLEELEALETITGSATYLKEGALPTVIIEGPITYTGVDITMLWNQSWELPENYSLDITASDNWTTNYNHSQINGMVMTFNETTGNQSGYVTDATMILAYKEDGSYIGEDGGPLKLVYLTEGDIISSRTISKYVVTITILA